MCRRFMSGGRRRRVEGPTSVYLHFTLWENLGLGLCNLMNVSSKVAAIHLLLSYCLQAFWKIDIRTTEIDCIEVTTKISSFYFMIEFK